MTIASNSAVPIDSPSCWVTLAAAPAAPKSEGSAVHVATANSGMIDIPRPRTDLELCRDAPEGCPGRAVRHEHHSAGLNGMLDGHKMASEQDVFVG